jgi:hypothetical protein
MGESLRGIMKPAYASISWMAPAVLLAGIIAGCASLQGVRDDASPFVHYEISLKDPSLEVITVTGRLYGTPGREVVLRQLHANDGSELQPISLVATASDGSRLDVEIREGDYIVEAGGEDFAFSYDMVLTIENRYSPDVRAMLTHLDGDRCRIVGRDILLIPEVPLSDGIIVDVGLFPDEPVLSPWPSNGNRMVVPSLKELPLTMAVTGDYRLIEDKIGGSEIRLAIAGAWSFADGEFFKVIRSIVSRELGLFGSAPHERYLFVCDRNPVRGDNRFDYYGVHFTAGMMIFLDPRIDRSELFGSTMAIVAHEFFHNWNGEAVRGGGDGFLWFIEGATVYYSYRILLDANIITQKQYEDRRESIRMRYLENPYLETVTISQSGNSDLNDKDMVNLLYDGGFFAAEAIDLRLREISGGDIGLIDVIKYFYENGLTADEQTLAGTIEHLCSTDLSPFISALIHSPEPEILVEQLATS